MEDGQKSLWKENRSYFTDLSVKSDRIFVVGVWHGAAWKYIVYGMYNGIIIAFSGLMAGNYKNWKKKLNITGKENWYYVFMIIRTFVLVNISWFFDRADTVGQALHMMRLAVTRFAPAELLLIPAGKEGTAFTPYALLILAVGCMILFIVSVLQERGIRIRRRCPDVVYRSQWQFIFACCYPLVSSDQQRQ